MKCTFLQSTSIHGMSELREPRLEEASLNLLYDTLERLSDAIRARGVESMTCLSVSSATEGSRSCESVIILIVVETESRLNRRRCARVEESVQIRTKNATQNLRIFIRISQSSPPTLIPSSPWLPSSNVLLLPSKPRLLPVGCSTMFPLPTSSANGMYHAPPHS